MNNSRSRKLALTGGIVVVLGLIVWWFGIAATFVNIKLPDGADSYKITNGKTGNLELSGTSSAIRLVKRGSYLVRYYQKSEIVGLQLWQPIAMPFAALKPIVIKPPIGSAAPFMGQPADFVTLLTAGHYLFLNTKSKAVELATSSGVRDISDQFGLTTTATGVYDSVVSIMPATANLAVVVTTKDVYLVNDNGDVTKLSLAIDNYPPNFYAASYDTKTTTILLLNSSDSVVYAYDLSRPSVGLQRFYNAKKIVQSISSGGGKVVLYGSNFPTNDPAAIKKYGQLYLTTPLVVDSATKQQVATLDEFSAPTMTLPSQTGNFIAIKAKFDSRLHVYSARTAQSIILPAYDVTGITWIGDELYLARDNAIWLYSADGGNVQLQKVADVGAAVTRLVASGTSLTTSTTSGVVFNVDTTGRSQSVLAADNLSGIVLSNSDYTSSFTAIGNNLAINTQSLNALHGDGIGDQATATERRLRATFPATPVSFTINKNRVSGYYRYAATSQ